MVTLCNCIFCFITVIPKKSASCTYHPTNVPERTYNLKESKVV